MSRVLLVRPEESRSQYDFQGVIENECLELEWIMTILKEAGHDVTFVDASGTPDQVYAEIQAILPL